MTCKKCEGLGFVESPMWTEYWKEHDVLSDNPEVVLAWFAGRFRVKKIPEEFISCACQGDPGSRREGIAQIGEGQ